MDIFIPCWVRWDYFLRNIRKTINDIVNGCMLRWYLSSDSDISHSCLANYYWLKKLFWPSISTWSMRNWWRPLLVLKIGWVCWHRIWWEWNMWRKYVDVHWKRYVGIFEANKTFGTKWIIWNLYTPDAYVFILLNG